MDKEFDISRIAKSDFNMDLICFQEYKAFFSVTGNGSKGDRECAVKCKLTGVVPWAVENREPNADRDPDGQTDFENACDEAVNLVEFVKFQLKQLKCKIDFCEYVVLNQQQEIYNKENTIQELIKAAVQEEVAA